MKSRAKLAPYAHPRVSFGRSRLGTSGLAQQGRRAGKIDHRSPSLDNSNGVDIAVGLAMAELRHIASNERFTLYPELEVGRSHGCALRLSSRMVSAHHASFRWSGAGWLLCDLGSSNGTFVNGRRLEVGERAPLAAGARVAFGDATNVFELINDGPPEPAAKTSNGETVFGEDDVLALPSSAEPLAIVRRNATGQWIADSGDGQGHSLSDGEAITVKGQSYQLILPLRWERTFQPDGSPALIDSIALRFEPSRNRDHVEIAILYNGQLTRLAPRAHGRLLLELAETRLTDQSSRDLPESEHGWMSSGDLSEACEEISQQQLNLQIHRARQQFVRAGIPDGRQLVERRRINGLIRIGVANVEIIAA